MRWELSVIWIYIYCCLVSKYLIGVNYKKKTYNEKRCPIPIIIVIIPTASDPFPTRSRSGFGWADRGLVRRSFSPLLATDWGSRTCHGGWSCRRSAPNHDWFPRFERPTGRHSVRTVFDWPPRFDRDSDWEIGHEAEESKSN